MDWTQLCTYKGPCIRWKETVPFPTLHICTKISAEVITHKHLSIYNQYMLAQFLQRLVWRLILFSDFGYLSHLYISHQLQLQKTLQFIVVWSKTLLANTIFGNNLHPDLKVKHSKARVSYVAMARVKRTGHNRLTIPVAPYSQFCSNSSLLYEVHTSSCQETILLKS